MLNCEQVPVPSGRAAASVMALEEVEGPLSEPTVPPV